MKNNYFCKSILTFMLLGFCVVSAGAKDVEKFKQLQGIYMLGNVYSVAVSPDSTRLAVTGIHGSKLYDFETCKEIATLLADSNKHFRSLVFSPDGKYIMVPVKNEIKLWDAKTGKLIKTLVKPYEFGFSSYAEWRKYAEQTRVVPWMPGGPDFEEFTLSFDEYEASKETYERVELKSDFEVAVFSSDGKSVTGISDDIFIISTTRIRTWDVVSGNQIGKFEIKLEPFSLPASSPYASQYVPYLQPLSASYYNNNHKIEPKHFKLFSSAPHGKNGIKVVEEIVAYNGNTQKHEYEYFIQIVETKTDKIIASLCEPASKIRPNCVLYSPNGERIVAGFEDGSVRIWDAKTGVEIPAPQFKSGSISAMEFSIDGRYLIIGSSSGSVTIWG